MTSELVNSVHLPPGPKGHFLLGIFGDYTRDPLGYLSQCAKEYGDIVHFPSVRFTAIKSYLINHPDYIEEVLATKSHQFSKYRQSFGIIGRLLGNGLVTSEGDFWRHQRRLMQPAFHRERIAAYGDVMVAYTNQMLNRWQAGEIRDVHEDMMRLTLEIVAKTLFDTDLAAEVAQEIGASLSLGITYYDQWFRNIVLTLLPETVPIPHYVRSRQVVQRLDAIIYDIIQQRRDSGEDKDDLLSMLLHAKYEDGTPISNQQLRDEMMTLFLAGHDTTALAMTWTWYLLSQHPEVEAKLLEELQTVLDGRDPTFADLSRLRYTDMVVREAIRLYPPVWAMARIANMDCELGGYPIKAGSIIIFSQWVMQRDSRYFDQPEVFNPDRWADGLAQRLPTYAYFPFGGGSRICIGKSFAQMEAVLLVATIAQKFHLTLVPGQEVTPWPAFTLRPRQGIKMLLGEASLACLS
ncbi:MAG TPA: cytochrome P450 [Coleofasciculaceae cyanobacterium]|jgi:cytochrome P450